jgi:hypothetical protein
MSSNQIAIVISNKKIMYGSNYPIRTVIPDDEFSDKHSMNSLFQLFGRAGRVGLAYRATVYISTTLAKRLYDFIHIEYGTNSIEVINMNKIIQRLVKEDNDLLIAKQEKEKLDLINKQKKELEKIRSLQINELISKNKLSTNNQSYNDQSYKNQLYKDQLYKDQNSYANITNSYTRKDNGQYRTPQYGNNTQFTNNEGIQNNQPTSYGNKLSHSENGRYPNSQYRNSQYRNSQYNTSYETQKTPFTADTSDNWRNDNKQQVISKSETSNGWNTIHQSNERDIYHPPMYKSVKPTFTNDKTNDSTLRK